MNIAATLSNKQTPAQKQKLEAIGAKLVDLTAEEEAFLKKVARPRNAFVIGTAVVIQVTAAVAAIYAIKRFVARG